MELKFSLGVWFGAIAGFWFARALQYAVEGEAFEALAVGFVAVFCFLVACIFYAQELPEAPEGSVKLSSGLLPCKNPSDSFIM